MVISMKFSIRLSIVILSLCATSCMPIPSSVITESGKAIYVSADEGVSKLTNDKGGEKRGKACVTNYFYLVSVGDASIKKAKENAGINNVSRVERSKSGFGFLSLFVPYNIGKSCTIVYGN